MTSTGAQHLGALLPGDCQLVAAPADWHARLPGKRAGPHCQRIQNMTSKARAPRMTIVLGATRVFLETRSHTRCY
eukprot:3528213-Pyramimonas_sp.AAC.1